MKEIFVICIIVDLNIISSARIVSASDDFGHVESKSSNVLIFDEGQNLPLEKWVTAGESQSFTNGRFLIAGIGGYVDTEYSKWWDSSDQRYWHYLYEYWRDKLRGVNTRRSKLIDTSRDDNKIQACDSALKIKCLW